MSEEVLKVGIVYQHFYDGSVSGPYLLKELPDYDEGLGFWKGRVHLHRLDGELNHVAHAKTLKNHP